MRLRSNRFGPADPAAPLRRRNSIKTSVAGQSSLPEGIHARTENRVRGRVFSLYMMAQMVGMTGSQFLLMTANPGTMALFLLAAALFLVGAVPVFAARATAPHHATIERVTLARLMGVMGGMDAMNATRDESTCDDAIRD